MAIEYLTFKEAMKYLGMKSPITLRSYIDAGLPVIEVGKSKKISKSDIDEFIAVWHPCIIVHCGNRKLYQNTRHFPSII